MPKPKRTKPATKARKAAARPAAKPVAKPADKAKPKVLLVEDDEFLSKIVMEKLQLSGYDALYAKDGVAGVKAAREKRPDAVLLDILIPKMDGFEVLRELKADPATKAIPVLMLTNLGKKEDVDKALALGAAEYLIKAHFAPSDMISRLDRTLGRSR